MSGKKNIDQNIKNRISDVLEKLTKEENSNNQEMIELLLDIQKNNPLLCNNFKFHELFDCMQNAVAIYEAVDNGKDFKFVGFNSAAEKIENITKEKIIGKKVTEVFPGIVKFGLLDIFRKVCKTGVSQNHPISIYEDNRIKGWRENYVYKLPTGEIVSTYRDVTKQKQAEEAVRKSEEKFKNLLHFAPDAFFHGDEIGNVIDCNDAATKLTGYSRKKLLSINISDLFRNNMLDKKPLRYDLLEAGKTIKSERELVRKNGKVIFIEMNSKKMSDGTFQSFIRDVTERKKTEDALIESEERYRKIVLNLRQAYYEADNKGLITHSNSELSLITGFTKSELIGKRSFSIVRRDHWRKVIADYQKCLLEKTLYATTEFIVTMKDGRNYWAEQFTNYQYDGKGNFIKSSSIVKNITERKNAEEALRESERNFRLLFENSPLGTYIADTKGNIIDGNRALLEILGSPSLEATKKINVLKFPPLVKNGYAEIFKKCVINNEVLSLDLAYTSKWGKERIFSSYIIPLSDSKGEVEKVYTIMEDVTDQKNAEEKLKRSEEKYRLITNLTSDYLFSTIIDESGKSVQTWVGGSFKEITGYTFEEYEKIGGWIRTIHPDDIGKDKEAFEKLLKNEKVNLEIRTIHKNGKVVWVKSFASPVWDKKKNKLIGINGACTDITKEKLASIALEENEEKYRLLSLVTSDYVFETTINEDGVSDLIWVGGSFEEITGYSFEEYKKHGGWREVIHSDDIKTNDDAYLENLANRTVSMEVRIYHKNGNIIWVRVFGYPMWDYSKNKLSGILGSVKDITKEKEALIAVQESKEKYKLISNITSDYLFESRFNEKSFLETIWVAGAFKKMTGYKLEEYKEIGGWSWLLHKDDIAIDVAAFEELSKNREAILEVRTLHKDGRIIWVRNTCSPIWDEENNKLLGVIGAVKDITEEKQNQIIHEIQYNIGNAIVNAPNVKELFAIVRKELNKILNAANFFIAFFDEKTGMLKADIDKDEKDDIETWSVEKAISGIVINKKKRLLINKKEIIKLIDTGKIDLIGTVPEVWLGVPIKVRGKAIGIMAVQNYDNRNAFDKTSVDLFEVIGNQLSLFLERNKAKEDALRLSRAIVQSPASVVITNIDGEIEYVNPKFEKVSGYTFEEVIGENPKIFKSDTMPKEFYDTLWATILAGKDWHGEFLNKRKDGGLYWENAVISPIENDIGQITHFVAIKEDITEKKKMIEELISSKEKAEVSEKIKTEFLAQMSHEIRSPLNVILSFVGLLKDDLAEIATEDMMLSFESIDSASTRITRTIDLILNMTDLQIGSYESSIESIDVVETLNRIHSEYNQSATRKGLDLRLKIEFNRKKINSDKYAIIQIISNLIDNAIKYSDKGFVEIFADKNERKDLVIRIKDTGIGISEEYLPNIFNSFSQEEQGYTRSYDGNGLGMALVKKYCDIIGADITVKSKKGKGTTFTLVIQSLKK